MQIGDLRDCKRLSAMWSARRELIPDIPDDWGEKSIKESLEEIDFLVLYAASVVPNNHRKLSEIILRERNATDDDESFSDYIYDIST